jgi:prepilin-type N-terminal cleavage/methylation domain-containing protein
MNQSMKTRYGFTITELLIALLIFVVVGAGILGSFKYFNVAGILSTKKAISLHEVRSGLDYMKHDLVIAKRIYVNDGTTPSTTPSFPASFNTTNNSALTLVVPSVNASGEFIDTTSNNYNDYLHYSVNASKQLIREVARSTEVGSARSTTTAILAEKINSITFSNGTVNLGGLAPWQLSAMNYAFVTVTTNVNTTQGGTPMVKSIVMDVVFRTFS